MPLSEKNKGSTAARAPQPRPVIGVSEFGTGHSAQYGRRVLVQMSPGDVRTPRGVTPSCVLRSGRVKQAGRYRQGRVSSIVIVIIMRHPSMAFPVSGQLRFMSTIDLQKKVQYTYIK